MLEYIILILITLVAIHTMIVHISVIRLKFYILKVLDEINKHEKQKYAEFAMQFNRVIKQINERYKQDKNG